MRSHLTAPCHAERARAVSAPQVAPVGWRLNATARLNRRDPDRCGHRDESLVRCDQEDAHRFPISPPHAPATVLLSLSNNC